MSKSGDIFRLLVIGLLEISSSIEVIFVGCLHFQNLVAHTVVCISYVSVIFSKSSLNEMSRRGEKDAGILSGLVYGGRSRNL